MITVSEGTHPFVDTARTAIESEDGAEALDTICRAYRTEADGWAARHQGAVTDVRSLTGRLRTSDDMVHTVHAVASAEILRNARLEAANRQLGRTLSAIRALVATAREAVDGQAPQLDVRAVLSDLEAAFAEPVHRPEFAPVVVAFVPEPARDRVGTFHSEDGSVTVAYPLVGWSMVVRQEEREPRRLEPTFLVEDRSLPESYIRDMYCVRMASLL